MSPSSIPCPSRACAACPSRSTTMFASLDEEALVEFDHQKLVRPHHRGDVLFHESTPATTVCCIHSGVAKVSRAAPHDRNYVLRLAGPGEILGLEAVLAGEPHGDTAEMLCDGIICHFDASYLRHLLAEHEPVRDALLHLLSSRLMEANADRAELASGDVRERTALVLLELADRWGIPQDGGGGVRIDLALTRQDLASLVGATTETVIRQLADLRRRGVLATTGRSLVVLDSERLCRVAHAR
jgi:CRP/FNR family transcriptional regulator, nitrogen oxide reductase regulator